MIETLHRCKLIMIKGISAAAEKNVGIRHFQLYHAMQLCILDFQCEVSLLARSFTLIHSAIMNKCFGKKRERR